MRSLSSTRIFSGGMLALAMLMIAGCGAEKASNVFSVSGNVSYDGKPIPKGNISFAPDASKNNQGPGATAEIKDGKYEMMPGKGISGGPYVLVINGYDGVPVASGEGGMDPNGKVLFESYKMTVDFPHEDTQRDLEIPKQK
ncbi:hypothetical protein Pan97_21320 [Bremerella volcania]|uniref:Carboxypeptidase regulatory-like domain-containing protein n=1 Tax=Bremerella volcania TaxID=2527984 RepID=A0A518C7A9_9BACT|nr:hypothetical protein [Bremerella volcania]QDU75110.1 hypothetical protein Pan97_21320 [Bremerella volcania]